MAEGFVRNTADGDWRVNEKPGARTMFVPNESQVGVRVHVPQPGRPTVGARTEGATILYARDETALSRDAGVEAETDTPAEAYAPFPKWVRRRR